MAPAHAASLPEPQAGWGHTLLPSSSYSPLATRPKAQGVGVPAGVAETLAVPL